MKEEGTTHLSKPRTRAIGKEGYPHVTEEISVEKWAGGLDLIFENEGGERIRYRMKHEAARLLNIHIGANLPVPKRAD